MGTIILLVFIVVAASVVIWRMFYSLRQEMIRAEEVSAVPVVALQPVVKEEQAKVEVQTPVKTKGRGLDDIPWRTPSADQKVEPLIVSEPVVSIPKDEIVPVSAMVEDQKVIYEKQIFQLKEEVRTTREKSVEQAKNALDVINKLRESNDRISAENEQLKMKKWQADQDETDHLKAENAALRDEVVHRDALLLEEVAGLRRVNEELKSANDIYMSEKESVGDVRSRMVFLETDNARLREKNEFLQYELTKVKAQSAGLQRVCDNFRKRIEEERFCKEEDLTVNH